MATAIVVGAALLGCALLVLADRLLLSPRALLVVEDVVTAPGRPIMLRASVERDIVLFWDPPIADVDVTFHAVETGGRRALGAARTDARGIATLAIPPFDAPARLLGVATLTASHPAFDAPFIVEALAPDRDVFVVDIDRTLAAVGPIMAALKDNAKIAPLAGAADGLRALAARYATILLTARDHIFRGKTLDWLRDNRFPDMPLLMRRGRRYWQQTPEDHKRERLAELASVVRLAAGVGDLPADALVYRERGMRSYLIGRATSDGAVTVRDWKSLLDDLTKAGLLPSASAAAPPPPPAAPSQSGTPDTE